MQHELAMRYLAQQRSEQLIGQAERHNLAAGLRPARSARIDRSIAALVARVTTSRREAWARTVVPRRPGGPSSTG
jgi:hypothetical protein